MSKKNETTENSLIPVEGKRPPHLFVLPLLNLVPLPGMVFPVAVRQGRPQVTVERALEQGEMVALFFSERDVPNDVKHAVGGKDLFPIGVFAKIIRRVKLPDGNWTIFVQCIQRVQLDKVVREQPFFLGRVDYLQDKVKPSKKMDALIRNVGNLVSAYIQSAEHLPEEISMSLMNIQDPGALTDFIGGNFPVPPEDRLALLQTLDVTKRLESISIILLKEIELAKLGAQLNDDLAHKIEERQKEYMLREQIKLIRKELGEEKDEREELREKYEAKISELEIPEEVVDRINHEMDRMSSMMPEAAEYHVIRTYLDWLTALPWGQSTEDHLDLKQARKVLDDEHYGLDDVKERILEFLAVRKIKADSKGSILCFIGPPGVGKTSLGRSIAHAMGRKFHRFSLGGMRDEAEIKGHRRTYIGAMPGKLIQSLKTVQSNNPVLVLDEIDKAGSDWRGDPSSALLEVLDPEQNHNFLDHYLDVPFDLSEIFFVATANVMDSIPRALLDRMEVIQIAGYLPEEKVEIAKRHLLPKQMRRHGLKKQQLSVTQSALKIIVSRYTRESGVRNLDRELARLCRKIAMLVATSRRAVTAKVKTEADVVKYLGAPKVSDDLLERIKRPGVAVGLAWTPVGGDVLCIETSRMPGKGKVQLTGQLGEVMSESARIALSYVKAHASQFKLTAEELDKWDLHIHFPAGAVKKDGPSAGITIATALISLFSGKTVRPKLAMSGEITLTGNVLAVGGLREKVVAARRQGIKKVIVPAANRKDIEELKPDLVKGLKFIYAKTYDEVCDQVLKL